MPNVPRTSPWHALDHAAAIAALEVDAENGLTSAEVATRRARHGDNALPEPPQHSTFAVFLDQFKSPLIYLLFGAAAIALALQEFNDAIVIAVVVVVNSAVGAYQEGRAERALAALRRLALQKSHVVRDGRAQLVDARELVPGDILILAAGDAVTADARLVDGAALQVAEAALTGESLPIAKDVPAVALEAPMTDRACMVYAGTHVTAGRARAAVVATGTETEIGRIATLAETAVKQRTPLERRVEHFGRQLMVAAAVMFAVFIAVGVLRGVPLAEIAMIGISQVVGLIPEGLPVAMTIALAVGVQRMARRGAIVRRLSAVETLGSTTVICTDKTGTLTRNEMTVTAAWLPDGRELAVTGSGYAPEGIVRDDGREVTSDPAVVRLAEAGALCNDARVTGPDDREARWKAIGDPTEAALITFAIKVGLVPDELRARLPRRTELPFDPDVKMMATQHGTRVIVKGALEAVVDLIADGEERRLAMRAAGERMAGNALRVLAVAELELEEPLQGFEQLRDQMTLLGLVGEIDPPRSEAKVAVARCRSAGIRPVMVTGDHHATGLAIARELGIANPGDLVIDGTELAKLSDDELAARLDRVAVFARVHPAQKLRIVGAYQRRGEVVAMTGDGVNDAPALMLSNVGVAMGATGTDVAKEASEMIVTDDDFGTIVGAVEEGRIVYGNIKKAVVLLFATSLGEVGVLLLAMVLGYPPPFVAVQILWNNLVTEGVITVNLVMQPAEGDEMERKPTPIRERLITRQMLWRVAVMTPAIIAASLGWFIYRVETGTPFESARSETFTLLAVCEWFNVLNCLSDHRSALNFGIFKNPWLLGGLVIGNLLQIAVIFIPAFNDVFHTVPFGFSQVLAIGAVASLVLWAEELRKLVVRMRARARARARADDGEPAGRWRHAS